MAVVTRHGMARRRLLWSNGVSDLEPKRLRSRSANRFYHFLFRIPEALLLINYGVPRTHGWGRVSQPEIKNLRSLVMVEDIQRMTDSSVRLVPKLKTWNTHKKVKKVNLVPVEHCKRNATGPHGDARPKKRPRPMPKSEQPVHPWTKIQSTIEPPWRRGPESVLF